MPNVLVTGSNGQLGSELKALASNDTHFFFTDKENLDITNQDALKAYIEINHITAIINCAAYTAVDKAEEEKIEADKINHVAVKYLAQMAKDKELPLIHISTDYVFDGRNYKPYIESDTTNPNTIYGKTKLDGEKIIQEINPKNTIIIRTSWVYSTYGNNFVKTMLRLGKERDFLNVIFDQVGSPTYAKDLAKAILDILPKIDNDKVEIYHYSNEGVCSWYDFAKSIFTLSNLDCHVNPIETKDYPTPAARPHYSLLNKAKIKNDFSITIPHWEESLKRCLENLEKR